MFKFVVFDLDGTIALCDHREHLVEGIKKDWPAFFEACHLDAPNLPVIAFMNLLVNADVRVEIWSGRSDEVIVKTRDWLQRHDVAPKLLARMRRAGDFTPDHELKGEWLKSLPAGQKPDLIVDDRQTVVDMWRENGIPCWQVAPGDFDRRPVVIRRSGGADPQHLTLMIGPSDDLQKARRNFKLRHYLGARQLPGARDRVVGPNPTRSVRRRHHPGSEQRGFSCAPPCGARPARGRVVGGGRFHEPAT